MKVYHFFLVGAYRLQYDKSMSALSAIGICFVPLLVMAALFLLTMKNLKPLQVLFAFLSGLLALIPIATIQYYAVKLPFLDTNTLLNMVLVAFVLNGFIEEGLKSASMLLIPWKKADVSSFTAAAILQGFALGSFEAVIYLITGTQDISLRLATAAVIHALCAGLSGLFIWTAHQKQTRIRPLITAILVHGIYNYFAGSTQFWWLSIITILYAAIRLRFFYMQIKNPDGTDSD